MKMEAVGSSEKLVAYHVSKYTASEPRRPRIKKKLVKYPKTQFINNVMMKSLLL